MSFFLYSMGPNLVVSPFPGRLRTPSTVLPGTRFSDFKIQRPCLRGNLVVARFGLGQVPFPDPDNTEMVIKDLFGRVEGILYTIADSAVSNSLDTVDGVATTKQSSDWLSGISNSMEAVLKVLKDGLSTLHVPYAYGFAIILLTVLVKAATFPLTKKQVESTMAMQSLGPQIKAIQERYAGDQERIQLETARLYKLAGINPLAGILFFPFLFSPGCLPTLATIPIWIGLYRALSNVADEGLLTEGFFWIPSLSGPTTIAARQTGGGTTWLFPFIHTDETSLLSSFSSEDGHPPLGWSDTLVFLVLPVLLIATQYISIQIMQPPQSNDPNLKNSQAITKLLPLMIGYFSLSVPSGLSLYWLTNNISSTTQQVWLRKFGGAKNPVKQVNDGTVKKEKPQSFKSMSEASPTASKVVKKEEKLMPVGRLRPGERFKRLKEEEDQRRRQREEDKRKGEAKDFQVTNGKVNKEASPLNDFIVNGDGADSEDDKKEDYEISDSRKSEIIDQHLCENVEKESVLC